MTWHVPGKIAAELGGAAQRKFLDAGDVGVTPREVASLRRQQRGGDHVRWHGEDGDIGWLSRRGTGMQRLTRAEVYGKLPGALVGVGQPDPRPSGAQRERDRGPDQTRADNYGRLRCACPPLPSHCAISSLSAAAPRK